MNIKPALAGIVGREHVSDTPEELEVYSRDHSLLPPRRPAYIVRPRTAEEILGLVKFAGEHRLPLVPASSGVHFHGGTIPSQGGIIVDLRRMNRVLGIDEHNRKVRIEPGVTWAQLGMELERHGFMPLFPLTPHPLKSVLTSHLEREPILIPKFEFGEPLLTTEVVWGRGQIFRTGAAAAGIGEGTGSIARGAFPHGPGLDWWRILQGAQGTMGILTWGNVKMEILPEVNKVFFVPFDDCAEAVELIYRVGRKMIGYEFLLLNQVNLAAILTESWPEDFDRLEGLLPPWTVILVLSGGPVRPEERIAYEEEALFEIAAELSIAHVKTSLAGIPAAERRILHILRHAWPEDRLYWKWGPFGECADLPFITTLERMPGFVQAVSAAAAAHSYPAEEIGCYVQPLEYGRACHVEFSFFYDPDDPEGVSAIRQLYADAARTALDLGAFYSRPYGILADLVYPRAGGYTLMLKKTKAILDPNHVLNPGKLCF